MKDYYNVLSDELKICNYYIDTIKNINSVNNTVNSTLNGTVNGTIVCNLIETSGYIARSKYIDIDEVCSFVSHSTIENNNQNFNFEEYKISTTLELYKIRDRITNHMNKAKNNRRFYNFLHMINLI